MYTVYTFGYTGFTVDELAAKAAELGAIIIDTRMSAFSRNSDFQMRSLIQRFGWAGYRYFGKSFGNVNYKSDTAPIALADVEAGLTAIEPILRKQPIILLCGCWSFVTCHRSVVAEAIRERFGVDVQHLTRREMPKDVKPQPKAEPEQGSLF
jgi:uncharacterized protein (DUF488 family)